MLFTTENVNEDKNYTRSFGALMVRLNALLTRRNRDSTNVDGST